MNNEKTEWRRSFIINAAYYALIIALIYLGLKYVAGWIMPFIIGFIIALSAKPAIKLIHKATKLNRKLCAALVLLIEYALIILILWGLGAKTVSFLKNLFTQLPSYYNDSIYPLMENINKLFIDVTSKVSPSTLNQVYSMLESLSANIREFVVKFSSSMVSYLAGVTAKLPFILISSIFTILASVFISMDYTNIVSFLMKQLPPKMQVFVIDAKNHLGKTLVGYLRAYSIILLITFTELSIGLSILRINNAIVIALIIALADILPVIGTGGILIPWGIISLINGNFYVGIGMLILYVVILLVRNFSEPKIVGDQLGLHPVVSLFSIYVGYRLFGVSGMILLPVTVTILVGLHKTGRIKLWVS